MMRTISQSLVVKQVGSLIRHAEKQRQTLIGLVLNKVHKTRELEDTPAVGGVIAKIRYMVQSSRKRAERRFPEKKTVR